MCQLLVETVRWRGGMRNKHSDFGWVDFSWVLLLRRGRNTQQRVGLSPAHLHPAKTLYNGTRLLPTLEGGSAAETWRGLDNVSDQGFHRPLQGSLTSAAGWEHGVPNLACGHALPAGCSGRWPRALLPASSTCLFAFTGMRGGINDSPGRCCQGSCNKYLLCVAGRISDGLLMSRASWQELFSRKQKKSKAFSQLGGAPALGSRAKASSELGSRKGRPSTYLNLCQIGFVRDFCPGGLGLSWVNLDMAEAMKATGVIFFFYITLRLG